MSSLTVRNIPHDLMKRIKTLSAVEKRSMNSEILFILERGLIKERRLIQNRHVSKETQVKIWNKLAGTWKDRRKTDKIVKDIYSTRSAGRNFSL